MLAYHVQECFGFLGGNGTAPVAEVLVQPDHLGSGKGCLLATVAQLHVQVSGAGDDTVVVGEPESRVHVFDGGEIGVAVGTGELGRIAELLAGLFELVDLLRLGRGGYLGWGGILEGDSEVLHDAADQAEDDEHGSGDQTLLAFGELVLGLGVGCTGSSFLLCVGV